MKSQASRKRRIRRVASAPAAWKYAAICSARGPSTSAREGVAIRLPPPISSRISFARGSHFGIAPRSATNGRWSGHGRHPRRSRRPASAATTALRASSPMIHSSPSFSCT